MGLFFGFGFYILTTFILKLDIHFVHLWGIEFVLNFIIMYLASKLYPIKNYVEENYDNPGKPWSLVNIAGIILVVLTVLIYVLLS